MQSAPTIKARPVRRHPSKFQRQRTARHNRRIMLFGVNFFFVAIGGLTGILLGAIVIHQVSPDNPVSKEVRAMVGRMIGD